MFAVVVHEENRPAWRKAFAQRDILIGRDPQAQIVVTDPTVESRHARLVVKDGRYILVDLKSTAGTFVNGQKLTAPRIVRETDVLVIGRTRLAIATLGYEELAGERYVPRDPAEAELADAIDRGDAASRLVYADWLEGEGDHERAELLRLQERPGADEADRARIRELASALELPWRARMLRLPIERCPRFAYACPKQWSELAPTAVEGVRSCAACQQHVYYCATIDEARGRAANGECVAIDIASPRWAADLEPPFGEAVCRACDLDVGEGLPYCPRCGGRVRPEVMLMGRMA